MPQPQQPFPPPPPSEPQQEGARWRFHRPKPDQVAAWFAQQPLDDGMTHEHYVGGIVLIPQNEKVKHTSPDGRQVERYEVIYTPYVQIGTRNAYFHRLAELRGLVPVIEAAEVPRSTKLDSPYFNANLKRGLWWHVIRDDRGQTVRYLCATWRVALYEPQSYADLLNGKQAFPVRAGEGTKQVGGGPDMNTIGKAETGAQGRALGTAGILVVGTGIATAEDMMELPGYAAQAPSADQAQLPPTPSEIPQGEQPEPMDATEELESLRSRAMALQAEVAEESASAAQHFHAWWSERKREEGWADLNAVPLEGMKAVIAKLEQVKQAAKG